MKKPKAKIKFKYEGLDLVNTSYAPCDYRAINTRKTNKKKHLNLALIRRNEDQSEDENLEELDDSIDEEEIDESIEEEEED